LTSPNNKLTQNKERKTYLVLLGEVMAQGGREEGFWVHPSNRWVVLQSTHLLVGFLFKI
jgi:hypothetical protein